MVLRCAQGILSLSLSPAELSEWQTCDIVVHVKKHLHTLKTASNFRPVSLEIPPNLCTKVLDERKQTSCTHICIVLICFCIFRNQKKDTPLYSWFLFSCFSAHIQPAVSRTGAKRGWFPTFFASYSASVASVVCHEILSAIRLHISVPVILCYLLQPILHNPTISASQVV